MLNISIAECVKGEQQAAARGLELIDEIDSITKEIQRFTKDKEDKEKSLSVAAKRQEAYRRASLLVRPLPIKLVRSRAKLLDMMERAKSKNITIARLETIAVDVQRLRAELQKMCPHPFILDEAGYVGSLIHEHEDARPGERRCVVCGCTESTYETVAYGPPGIDRKWKFEKLTESDQRIIQREPWINSGKDKFDIRMPLGAVLHPFEQSVVDDLNK